MHAFLQQVALLQLLKMGVPCAIYTISGYVTNGCLAYAKVANIRHGSELVSSLHVRMDISGMVGNYVNTHQRNKKLLSHEV